MSIHYIYVKVLKIVERRRIFFSEIRLNSILKNLKTMWVNVHAINLQVYYNA